MISRQIALGLCLSLGLSACAELPASGPATPQMIDKKTSADARGYSLVTVSPAVLDVLMTKGPAGMAAAFSTGQPAPIQNVGIGDSVAVTLWEVGSGLFSSGSNQASMATSTSAPGMAMAPSGASSLNVPTQVVDQSGAISVPFAGRIEAAGRTPYAIQREIESALVGKANDAQAIVNVTQTVGDAVTVTGDVNHPLRLPLTVGGTRLLDAIAAAGGTLAPASDMAVQVTRGETTQRTRLISVIDRPAENIFLEPNDIVVLDREPQSVVVLGATIRNAQVPFGKSDFTLAEALANGGGLTDIQADPYGVFVLRYEPGSVLDALHAPHVDAADPKGLRPVVYHVDLKNPLGLFMAQSFQMHDRDLVYVSNSQSVQLTKLVRLFSIVASIFNRSAVVSN